MVVAHTLISLCLFVGLSVQLPRPNTANPLQKRYQTTSYSTSFSRSASIIDNQRQKYLFPIQIGSSSLDVELDTGSADTWVIQTDFSCYQTYNSNQGYINAEDASYCNFGETYTPGDEFTPVEDLFQLTCYGESTEQTLRCVSGPFGWAPISMAGLDVPQQLIAAPNMVR
jgi:hypothetical protein